MIEFGQRISNIVCLLLSVSTLEFLKLCYINKNPIDGVSNLSRRSRFLRNPLVKKFRINFQYHSIISKLGTPSNIKKSSFNFSLIICSLPKWNCICKQEFTLVNSDYASTTTRPRVMKRTAIRIHLNPLSRWIIPLYRNHSTVMNIFFTKNNNILPVTRPLNIREDSFKDTTNIFDHQILNSYQVGLHHTCFHKFHHTKMGIT